MPYSNGLITGMPWPDWQLWHYAITAAANSAPLDALNDAFAMMGYIRWADCGTHTVSAAGGGSIGFVLGTTVFAQALSTIRIGLQGIHATLGAGPRPNGVYDVSASFVGNTAPLTTGVWNVKSMTGGSGSKTMAEGDKVAIMCELTARAAADSVIFSSHGVNASFQNIFPVCNELIDGVWTKTGNVTFQSPKCAIIADDGTWGSVGLVPPITPGAATAFANSSTPDERGLEFKVPFPCKAREVFADCFGQTVAADWEICIYRDPSGTPSLIGTAAIQGELSGRASGGSGGNMHAFLPSEIEFVVGTKYGITIKPTTTTSINYHAWTLAHADVRKLFPAGEDLKYLTRTDGGAFTASATALTWPKVGVMLRAFELGGGARPTLAIGI
jgi:hypothetical protein